MNPHDQNGPTPPPPWPSALGLLGRLFFCSLSIAAGFTAGYLSAETRFKMDPPYCVEKPVQQMPMPKTKAQMKDFLKSYYEQDRGWIK